MKACSKCGVIKPLGHFHKNSKNKSGFASHCKECDSARKAEYRAANKEKVRTQAKALYDADPEKRKASHRRWVEKNPEKMKEAKRRCRSTPKAKLENNIRGYVHKTITKGYKFQHTFEALGYSSTELMRHLERKFLPGMSWENYGDWHIDHEIPLSAFNYETTSDIDFQRAWSLSNLQPLWKRDNLVKKDKLLKPFQPSLALRMPAPANDNKESNVADAA